MKAIYKYPIELDRPTLVMPGGAVPLSVQYQGDTLCLWAVVDTDEQLVNRVIHVFGTGHPIASESDIASYIGTAQHPKLPLVFHVFDGGEFQL